MFAVEELLGWTLGACFVPGAGTRFSVWAPEANSVTVQLTGRGQSWELPLARGEAGYFTGTDPQAQGGDHYLYRLDDGPGRPDPASRSQPQGVFGPSEIVPREFEWTDGSWKGPENEELTLYEAHVGCYSPNGRFDGLIERLPQLSRLGVTALELMPVAQFPGRRGWGYDGVFPFAAQDSYGGPRELKKLVNACHAAGLGVILDVVYNHLGPEGCVLQDFGPYFQERYHTPWGAALNFDGAWSDEVKRYFCLNLVQWLEEFHFDGLRLDAVHAICDLSQHPLLECLSETKRALERRSGRNLHLIAESDLNDPRVLRPPSLGGVEMDFQWSDDFHHALHALLTGERQAYYQDFGRLEDLAEAYRHGTVYRDRYSPYRKCSRGRSFEGIRRLRLLAYTQNHDQVGNRPLGDRVLAQRGLQRLAAACVLLSPFTPMLFMGEELGDAHPFHYFVDHRSPELLEAIRRGRAREHRDPLARQAGPPGPGVLPPDPADPLAFERSRVAARAEPGRDLSEYYRALIAISKWLRRERLLEPPRAQVSCDEAARILQVGSRPGAHAIFSFNPEPVRLRPPAFSHVLFDSSGEPPAPGSPEIVVPPFSALLLETHGTEPGDRP